MRVDCPHFKNGVLVSTKRVVSNWINDLAEKKVTFQVKKERHLPSSSPPQGHDKEVILVRRFYFMSESNLTNCLSKKDMGREAI